MDEKIRYVTAREAASVLKVCERTVLRWVASGELPARRVGRRIRIDESTLRSPGVASGPTGRAGRKAGSGKRGDASSLRKGSPAAVLRSCGTLSTDDLAVLMKPIVESHDEPWERK